MVVVHTLILALVKIINAFVNVYFFIVLIACLLTWVNADPYNPIVRALRSLTEPLLWRIRKLMPIVYKSGIDFSPVVLLLALQIAGFIVTSLLLSLL